MYKNYLKVKYFFVGAFIYFCGRSFVLIRIYFLLKDGMDFGNWEWTKVGKAVLSQEGLVWNIAINWLLLVTYFLNILSYILSKYTSLVNSTTFFFSFYTSPGLKLNLVELFTEWDSF